MTHQEKRNDKKGNAFRNKDSTAITRCNGLGLHCDLITEIGEDDLANNGLIADSMGRNSGALNTESIQKRKVVNTRDVRGEGQQSRKGKIVIREFGPFSARPSLGGRSPQGPTMRYNEMGQGNKTYEVHDPTHFETMGGLAQREMDRPLISKEDNLGLPLSPDPSATIHHVQNQLDPLNHSAVQIEDRAGQMNESNPIAINDFEAHPVADRK